MRTARIGNPLRGKAAGYTALEQEGSGDSGTLRNARYHLSGDKYVIYIDKAAYYLWPTASEKEPAASAYASPLTLGDIYASSTGGKRFRIVDILPGKE